MSEGGTLRGGCNGEGLKGEEGAMSKGESMSKLSITNE